MAEWITIAETYETLWNFPLCVGAIDGKHVNFRAPRTEGSHYYNYKGHHSIVLLAACTADYKFTYIDVGVNGRISDGGVFRNSKLRELIVNDKMQLPPHRMLPGQSSPLPYVFVADDAFPLTNRIMKPYSSRGLHRTRRIFNYRLARARRTIENAFGILSNRFRILLTTINLSADKVEIITLATCALHNFLLNKGTTYVTDELELLQSRNNDSLNSVNNSQGPNRSIL